MACCRDSVDGKVPVQRRWWGAARRDSHRRSAGSEGLLPGELLLIQFVRGRFLRLAGYGKTEKFNTQYHSMTRI